MGSSEATDGETVPIKENNTKYKSIEGSTICTEDVM